MGLIIREMHPEDCDQKGYVHWKCWQETYTGLVDKSYLSHLSLEKCRNMAYRWPENTFVAELDGKIVGFSCYSAFDVDPLPRHGELMALYVLKEAQNMGIGKALMQAALGKLADYREIHLWVLKGNNRAISFYEHFGFHLDGVSREIKLGAPNTALRMIHQQKPHLSLDFELFYARLCDDDYTNIINETNFYIEDDPVYDCCWLGRLDGEKPYWYGLVHDGTQAYEYATAQELVDSKVFNGRSLREIWSKVRFYSIGSIDPDTWLSRYG